MRDSYYLPWERRRGDGSVIPGSMDFDTRRAISRVGDETAKHCHRTSAEIQEQVYRLLGWDCTEAE